MEQNSYVISTRHIHARPTTMLVQTTKFDSDIQLEYNGKSYKNHGVMRQVAVKMLNWYADVMNLTFKQS